MLTPDLVREIDIDLRELYFDIEDQVWNPPLPELRNTDWRAARSDDADVSAAVQSVGGRSID